MNLESQREHAYEFVSPKIYILKVYLPVPHNVTLFGNSIIAVVIS